MDLTENDLRAAIKGLSDVVAPAVDPKDALANEQLRLVIDYLRFLRERIDLLGHRDRLELRQQVEAAQALIALDVADAPTAQALKAAAQAGAADLANGDAAPGACKRSTAAIAAVIRDGTRSARQWPTAAARRWEACVLQSSLARIAFEQSWYLPLGFEPSPGEVRPVRAFFPGAS